MNIPEGFVLVPVELTDAMKDVALKWGTKKTEWEELLAASTPVELPAYDEAKERARFEIYALEVIAPYFMSPKECLMRSGETYMYGQPATAWCAWKACAQSRDGSVSDE